MTINELIAQLTLLRADGLDGNTQVSVFTVNDDGDNMSTTDIEIGVEGNIIGFVAPGNESRGTTTANPPCYTSN